MVYEVLDLCNDDIFWNFFIGCNVLAVSIWIFSLITNNISHMDRLWAILPNVYAWLFIYTGIAYYNGSNSILKGDNSSLSRLVLMAVLAGVWGVRLVYVFWRRGYYKSDFEDPRWELVKKRFNYPERKIAFHIFNFLFMGFMQNWILFGHSLPFWFVQTNTASGRLSHQPPLNVLDLVMACLFVVFFMFEFIADEQQWNFQSKKHAWLASQKSGTTTEAYSQEEIDDFKRGFLVKGLFKYCRHPNYFGELFLWWAMYGFTISSQYSILKENFEFSVLVNYAMFSPLIMSFLFKRSSRVTEKISAKKYPEYADYQKKVPGFIPSFTPYEPKKL